MGGTSIKKMMTNLSVEGIEAETLRYDTRTFLMDQNDNKNINVARLSLQDIKKTAERFLRLKGHKYFSGLERTHLVWPTDGPELIERIGQIMWHQKRQKSKRFKPSELLEEDASVSLSESDDSDVVPVRRRVTTDEREYNPEEFLVDSPHTRQYTTRSATQPGMPPIPSIEIDLENDSNGNSISRSHNNNSNDNHRTYDDNNSHRRKSRRSKSRAKKKRRLTMFNPTTGSISRYQSVVRGKTVEPQGTQSSLHTSERTIRVDIPFRTGVPETEKSQNPPHVLASISESVPVSGLVTVPVPTPPITEEPPTSSVRSRPSGRMAAIEAGEPVSPLPWPEFNFDRLLDRTNLIPDLDVSEVQVGIGVPAPPRCEATPPSSSRIGEDDIVPRTQRGAKRRRRLETTIEPEDLRIMLRHDQEDLGVEIEHETAMIHLGGDEFKVVQKSRALKIVQKLIDFHIGELRLCQRNAHQAPTVEKRRFYEIRAKYLAKLFETIRNDEIIWLGGEEDDRTVAML